MSVRLRPLIGDSAARAAELWRTKQLEYTFRRAAMGKYENFDVCTRQALGFVLASRVLSGILRASAGWTKGYFYVGTDPDSSRVTAPERFAIIEMPGWPCHNLLHDRKGAKTSERRKPTQ